MPGEVNVAIKDTNSQVFSHKGTNIDLNPPYMDPNFSRKPEFQVYLYSMSKRSYEVSRPPQIATQNIKACPGDQDYILVRSFDSPFPQPIRDANGILAFNWIDARRLAMDIINPANLSLDQSFRVDPAIMQFSQGTDLGVKGVFWSPNNPPKPEEIEAARIRMETYYTALLEKARTLELTDKKKLEEELGQNQDYNIAAEYYDIDTSWHTKLVRKASKIECPNCGDQIKAGIAFHKNEEGYDCILDWERAVKAGIKKKSDVPEGKEWWTVDVESQPAVPTNIKK